MKISKQENIKRTRNILLIENILLTKKSKVILVLYDFGRSGVITGTIHQQTKKKIEKKS